MSCGCCDQIIDCGCNGGSTVPVVPNDCRQPVSQGEIAQLIWLFGLDANNCRRYQRLVDSFGLLACDGSAISGATPLVTCTLFKPTLCDTLVGLVAGGTATPSTKLVAADCKTYTLPSAFTLAVEDTDTVDLTYASNTISADVIISDTAGNILVNDDGLYVPTPPVVAFDVTATDGDCLNLSVVEFPANNFLITGDVVVSPVEGNAIECTPDGLYAPIPDEVIVAITAVDTDCIDVTIGNPSPNVFTISADVIVSSAPDNILVCDNDGLYVPEPEPVDVQISAVDTATINFTITEPSDNTFVVTGDVIVSPTVGNQLVATGNGLYVPTPADPDIVIAGVSNTCADVLVVEGTPNHFTVETQVVVSPNPVNVLTCDITGLLVPAVVINALDSNCINVGVVESPDQVFTIGADIIISPTAGNTITCEANGLYVPEPEIPVVTLTNLPTSCIDVTINDSFYPDIQIQIQPVISPAIGNVLNCLVDGLFVAETGTDIFVEVSDTDCIDMTVIESPAGTFTISADPIISPDAGNTITCIGNGLYAARGPLIVTAIIDTGTIDPTSGTDVYVYAGPAAGGVTLTDPTGSEKNDLWVKNTATGDLTITAASSIDGVGVITLQGTTAGTYPFNNNGGESVHLVFTGATWLVL